MARPDCMDGVEFAIFAMVGLAQLGLLAIAASGVAVVAGALIGLGYLAYWIFA